MEGVSPVTKPFLSGSLQYLLFDLRTRLTCHANTAVGVQMDSAVDRRGEQARGSHEQVLLPFWAGQHEGEPSDSQLECQAFSMETLAPHPRAPSSPA